jgi:hypothetical protein
MPAIFPEQNLQQIGQTLMGSGCSKVFPYVIALILFRFF